MRSLKVHITGKGMREGTGRGIREGGAVGALQVLTGEEEKG